MELVNKGHKVYEFATGDRVDATFNKEIYSGGFIGTLRSEATETITFVDKKNELKAEISFGKIKKKYYVVYLDLLIISKAISCIRERLSAASMALTAAISISIRFATGMEGSSKLSRYKRFYQA